MTQAVYVDIDTDERAMLVRLLSISASEDLYYLNVNDDERVERQLARTEALIERVDSDTPLTRADVLAAVRAIGYLPAIALKYPLEDRLDTRAYALCVRLRSRCANALRASRQRAS